MEGEIRMKWYSKHLKDVVDIFETDTKKGLSTGQAAKNMSEYGKNILVEKKKENIIVRFLLQFNDFMIIVLLAAAAISFGTSILQGEKDFIDPIIILLIVTLNAILGLAQESKAEKALEALKKMSAPTSKVMRDGKLLHTSTEDIVPGDLIILETGDLVPADARLVSAINLNIDESALTGESLPVEKDEKLVLNAETTIGDRKNMVYSGSSVSYGRGAAIVVETAMNTEVGKIAALILGEDSKETPLQKKLAETGKALGIGALIVCTIIFVIGILRKITAFEMFMTSVGLAVAAIPEGLPAIVTIMLAIGVQRMAGRNAIIRKLPAVETLGGASVICSDKTGTLTQNKMKVVELSDGSMSLKGKSDLSDLILKLTTLCNDAQLLKTGSEFDVQGDPTERAFVVAALSSSIDKNNLEKEMPRLAEVPFDSKRKLMTTIHKNSTSGYIAITKGAPDFLLEKCTHFYDGEKKFPLNDVKRREILDSNAKMADKALRVLAVGFKEISAVPSKATPENMERDVIFVGLVGMIDPPREEVRGAVEICIQAGIKPVMVTGDHVSTAVAIAKKIGILQPRDKAMTGNELNELSQEELSEKISQYSVFARVSPEHKVRIVKAFQSKGAIVAMTGDGVNDAPALKAADIGCAMGITGTDVAKGAADMILTDDNFATIVDAVKEGRGIFANIRKAVHFLLASNIGEILTILVAILMGWQSPLLAIQLLWVNLVTDSLPAIALGLDPAEDDVMDRKPIKNDKQLFSGGLWQRIILEGCMIGMLSLIAFIIGAQHSQAAGRTMAFATLSISQLVHAFNVRSNKSIFEMDLFSNVYLIAAFIVGIILQVSVISIEPIANIFKVMPLQPMQWLIVLFLCCMPVVICELEKFWNSRLQVEQSENKKLNHSAIAK